MPPGAVRDAKLRARAIRLAPEPRETAERVQDDLFDLDPLTLRRQRMRQLVPEDREEQQERRDDADDERGRVG